MKEILVSIITPLYNRVDLVGETIRSVIAQTYLHWEMIVVDDGSTDGAYEYVQEIAQQELRINAFRRDRTPKGGSTCRNIGLERAEGEYVVFLDSDDLLAPHCLQQRVQLFQQYPEHDFLVFPTRSFKQQPDYDSEKFDRIFYQDYLTSFLLQSHWLIMEPIWKKSSLKVLGGFDEQLTCMQDGDLHRRAIIQGLKFEFFKENRYLDNYFRKGNAHPRISNSKSLENNESKVYAYQKLVRLLRQYGLLSPIRRTILAGHLLSLSVNYRLMGEGKQAYRLWRTTRQQKITDAYVYWVGKSFIWVRAQPFVRRSRQQIRRAISYYQKITPRFLLWPIHRRENP